MGKTILIADDDLTSRMIVAKQCESIGYAVILASNGRLAWEILHDNPDVALLVTDVDMPELDGRDLVQRVRADGNFDQLPVIFMSGVVGPNQISELLNEGVNRFLPKPIDPRILRDYVTALL